MAPKRTRNFPPRSADNHRMQQRTRWVDYRVSGKTKLQRPRREGLDRLRAEVTRVDPSAERMARYLDHLARSSEEAAAFTPPASYQDGAPRALLSI